MFTYKYDKREVPQLHVSNFTQINILFLHKKLILAKSINFALLALSSYQKLNKIRHTDKKIYANKLSIIFLNNYTYYNCSINSVKSSK